MPNWCDTSYYVTTKNSNDPKEKSMLLKFIMDVTVATGDKYEKEGGDFGSSWLGNLYREAGCRWDEKLGTWIDKWVQCRGSIESNYVIEDENGGMKGILLVCETAWESMIESFETLLNEKYPGLIATCQAEEPGNQIFINTDVNHLYFTTEWQIDDDCDIENFGYDEEDRLLKTIEEITGKLYKSAADAEAHIEEIEENYKKVRAADDKAAGLEVNEDNYFIYLNKFLH